MRFLLTFARMSAWLASLALTFAATAADFSVTPIRAELLPGAMSETITVSNDSPSRLRVSVKLMKWTQDATGKDVYTASTDLVYFPRVMDIEPGASRLIRVGTKAPSQGAERTYRLFIEEAPPAASSAPTAVTFYFRFGVPVFVPPPGGAAQPEVLEPQLHKGKLSLVVRNTGNAHFRAAKVTFTDGAAWTYEAPGWYSLAGASRTYETTLPPEVCRQAKVISVRVEAANAQFDRKLDVSPASCS